MNQSDPAKLYRRRELCAPVPIADAEKRMNEFFDAFYELRKKFGVPDALVIAKLNVLQESGEEGYVMVKMHAGSQLEYVRAWRHGPMGTGSGRAAEDDFRDTERDASRRRRLAGRKRGLDSSTA